MNYYDEYAKYRNARGMKDSDVAKLTGIPPSTFTDWKNNKSKPKYEKLQKISKVLGIKISDISEIQGLEYKNYYKSLLDSDAQTVYLRPLEKQLIDVFRNADENKRALILLAAGIEETKKENNQPKRKVIVISSDNKKKK